MVVVQFNIWFNLCSFWQIGRIPNEWARCMLPLVRDNKIRVEGQCKFAPNVLGIMDTIILLIRYIQREKLQACYLYVQYELQCFVMLKYLFIGLYGSLLDFYDV